MFHYLVKEDEFLPVKEVDDKGLKSLNSEIRRKILEKASEKKVSIEDLTESLDIKQQSAYYHIEDMLDSGLLEATDGRPRYFAAENTAYYFRPDFVEPEENPLMLENVPEILEGFVENRRIKAKVVVGAPYPHGAYDRRHRTGYKAGEVALLLGNYGKKSRKLIYTDTEIENNPGLNQGPIISVAGPRVNTVSAGSNSNMPARFDPSNNYDSIITQENSYGNAEVGIVAREEIDGRPVMTVAGVSGIGTSGAIKALASRPEELGEKGAVVKGYGTKHNIEEVEIVEKL